jgi:hypothetical protein
MTKETNELIILCPYCSAPYTSRMEEDLTASIGCETCGDTEINGQIDIYCTNCKKLVYRKEF